MIYDKSCFLLVIFEEIGKFLIYWVGKKYMYNIKIFIGEIVF